MTEVLDFTVFVPEPKIAKVGSGKNIEEVDVSLFPAEATLYLIRVLDQKRKVWESEHPDAKTGPAPEEVALTMEELIEVVSRACRVTNPKITAEWLRGNCSYLQLNKFCTWMMRHAEEQVNVGGKQVESANAASAQAWLRRNAPTININRVIQTKTQSATEVAAATRRGLRDGALEIGL